MSDIITTAAIAVTAFNRIAQLPAAAQSAADAFQAISYAQGPPAPVFPADKVTEKSVEQLLIDHAKELAWQAHLNQARMDARYGLARRLVTALAEAAPGIIETLEPPVTAAWSEHVEAINALPENLSAASVITATDGSQNYQTALAAQDVILSARAFVGDVSALPAYALFQPQPELTLFTASGRNQLQDMMNAPATGSDLDDLLVYAARQGLPIRLADPATAHQERQALDAQPQESRFPGMARMVGDRIVKADGTPVHS